MNLFQTYVNYWYRNRYFLKYIFYCQIHVTKRCQNTCSHCYFNELRAAPLDMDIKELERILIDVRKRSDSLRLSPRVDFTGGDPLLYPYLDNAVEICQKLCIPFGFKCNPEEIIRHNKRIMNILKLSSGVSLSIDGLEEKHDSIRKKGSFQNAMRAIEILKQSGIHLKINTTVSYDNISDLIPLIEFINMSGIVVDDYTWARYWSKKNTEKIIKCIDLDRAFSEMTNYLISYFNQAENYIHTDDGRIVPRIMFGFKEHQWYPFLVNRGLIEPDVQQKIDAEPNCINCTATKHFYIIDPDSSIYKCRKLPESKIEYQDFGNINVCQVHRRNRECQDCRFFNGCGGCMAIEKALHSQNLNDCIYKC